jgi:hypothetical protein
LCHDDLFSEPQSGWTPIFVYQLSAAAVDKAATKSNSIHWPRFRPPFPINHDSFAFLLASKLFLSTSSPVPCGSIAIPGTILETINLAFFLSSAGTTYQGAASSYPDV